LVALHAERETAEEEARRKAEQDEDDALVAQLFSKVPAALPQIASTVNGKGKGKAKAEATPDVDGAADGSSGSEDEGSMEDTALPSLTVKRKIALGNGGIAEPTVASLLAAKGRVFEVNGGSNGVGGARGMSGAVAVGQAAAKRKREGMQKLLGIKKRK
jgi:hypothetical protein